LSKPGPPTSYTKLRRQRRANVLRKERIHKYVELIKALSQLAVEAVARGEAKEAVKINARVRLLRQQVRYMGGEGKL
jgi:NADH/NAD ratio-sensing transcriptional regulator Rex